MLEKSPKQKNGASPNSSELNVPMPQKVKIQPEAEQRIRQRLAQLIEALVNDEDVGTFRKLGQLTGIGHNTIHNWSNCTSDPHLQKLSQFAYRLGWSMSELMLFAEGNESPQEAILRKKQETSKFQSPPRIRQRAETDISLTGCS